MKYVDIVKAWILAKIANIVGDVKDVKEWVLRQIKQFSTWIGGILGTVALMWPYIENNIPGVIDNLFANHPDYAPIARGVAGLVGLWAILWNQDKNKS
jgi:hypothetical protein